MKKEVVSMLLDKIPAEVNKIINKEQLRLALNEEDLKKPHVVYKIIKEWFIFKSKTK